jgi:signal-transduction protein with cAMP-binding, CBS, and nucleotidyltransferase domain
VTIFAGNSGDQVLTSRRVTTLKESLAANAAAYLSALASGEGCRLHAELALRLDDEMAWEEGFRQRLAEELDAMDSLAATALDEAAVRRGALLAAEHFGRRSSVVAIHQICNLYRDALVRRAMDLALAAAFPKGSHPRYALLVSGDMGRQEQTLLGESVRFYLVYDGEGAGERPAWEGAGRLLEEFLGRMGFLAGPGLAPAPEAFWIGPPGRFVLESGDTCLAGDERADFPFLPDLRGVSGDAEMALALTDASIGIIRDHPDFFVRRARRAATLPVATSFFGWYRTERSGEHRGEFDLVQYCLNPLVRTICVLALKRKVRRFSTIERIKGLLAAGGLSVALAEGLLAAYQEFMTHKIRAQVESLEGGFQGYFVDPGSLSYEDEERFRTSLDTVVTLQKHVYHQLVGQV